MLDFNSDDEDGLWNAFGASIGILTVVVFLVFAGLLLLVSKAFSHSFYPMECCSDRDCWPMGSDTDAKEPEPKAMHSGWTLADGGIVPYHETRPSPDGRFHICRQSGVLNGSVIRPNGRPVCLFTPQHGS